MGFHLVLLEQSEISVDKHLPTYTLLNQTTHQFRGNQTGGNRGKPSKGEENSDLFLWW